MVIRNTSKKKNDQKIIRRNKQKGGFTDYWRNDDETRDLFLEASFILGNRHQYRGNNVFYNSNEDFTMDERCFQMIGSDTDIMTFENDFMCFKNDSQRHKMSQTILQQINNLTTNILTTNGFKSEKCWEKFVSHFYDIVQKEINSYFGNDPIEAFIIYKGGNTIVKYLEKILNFPNQEEIPTELQKLLSRSDADFEIVFENEEAFFNHHAQIKIIIIKCLNQFRNWLSTNKQILDTNHIENIIVDRIEDYETIVGKQNIKIDLQKRNDRFILKKGGNLGKLILGDDFVNNLNNDCSLMIFPKILKNVRISPFFITWNDTLTFHENFNIASFELIRLKLNFNLSVDKCDYNISSELIDVSIANPIDSKFKKKRLDEWTNFIMIDNIQIRIPSLDYLINKDLKNILMDKSEFPWHNDKYEKRLNRVILGSVALSSTHIDKLGNVSNSILNRFGNNKGRKTISAMKLLISILNSGNYNELDNPKGEHSQLLKPFRTLIHIILNSKENIWDPELLNDFNHMISTIVNTLKTALEYYERIYNKELHSINTLWFGSNT